MLSAMIFYGTYNTQEKNKMLGGSRSHVQTSHFYLAYILRSPEMCA